MIQVECDCGRVIKTQDENAGKKARCPDCGEVVQIPAARKASATKFTATKPAGKSPASSAKRRPPEDEFDDGAMDDDADFGDDEIGDDEEQEARLPKSKKAGAKSSGKKSSKVKGDDEPPAKKKKKKKADDGDLNKKILIGSGVAVGLVVLGLGIFLMTKLPSAGGGGKVEVPQNFVEFSSAQGEIRCQVPKDWQTKSGGGTGGVPPHASFESGSVKVTFRSSPSGASFQMMAQAGSQDPSEMPDELKPVSQVHEIQKRKFQDEMSGYQEQGNPVMIKTVGFGEGRMSEFTASAGLLGKVYGYRVTLLGTNNQWNLVCQCSANQWKDFQPVFRRIIESAGGS